MYPELTTLILFGIAGAYIPGPNNVIASHSGFNFGFIKTIPLILGVGFGWTFILVLFESGLIFVFQQFPILQNIIKFIGTIFIVYLAYKIAFMRIETTKANKVPITFVDTLLLQIVNPQGILTAMLIVSTFLDPNNNYLRDAIWVTSIMFVIAVSSVAFWVLIGQYLRKVATNEKFIKIFNYSMSFLLIVCVILFYV
jgi:threonine/homoserine/homoserine lactone efflux protein|tara:strand:+ start:800 stop:1390 length:591 start_codon:yes stop_codon:yes gene_type:complete